MRLLVLFIIVCIKATSYDSFIIDGNSSAYQHINHIVNTNNDKVYFAIAYNANISPIKRILRIGTNRNISISGSNVIFTEIATIPDTFLINKMIALKDNTGRYTGSYVMAGSENNRGALRRFSVTNNGFTYALDSNKSFIDLISINDMIHDSGTEIYITGHKTSIFAQAKQLTITDTGIQLKLAELNIYTHGYLNINRVVNILESYLVEVDLDFNITREFSYNLANGNASVSNSLFALGFDKDNNISLMGSVIGAGSNDLIALNVNASRYTTNTIPLLSTNLITPIWTRANNQSRGTAIQKGSKVEFLTVTGLDANNATIIISPAYNATIITDGYKLNATADVEVLTRGYYNVSLGAPFNSVINWLDVNCSVGNSKYMIPWNEQEINAVGKPNIISPSPNPTYANCMSNERFLYQNEDDNITLIQRKWEFIYPKESVIKWKLNDIRAKKITGNPPEGRIETIRSDNTSIFMIKDNANPNGVSLLRIDDSSQGLTKNQRIKWEKDFLLGNSSVNTANLLATPSEDFVVAGRIVDFTREKSLSYDCMVIKFDKNGNELWTKHLGGFHNDNCYSIVIEKNNTSPYYNEYVVVGSSGTRNEDDINESTAYGILFRDEGSLIHVRDGWSLISNPTDRNITADGKKEESNTMGVVNLGAHKSYFQFKKNQWLVNEYPIESLDGFWLYTIDGLHDIFLEGNLIEQQFKSKNIGWSLLGTGVELINAQTKHNLESIWKYKAGKWEENPIRIKPGEGFWAKRVK